MEKLKNLFKYMNVKVKNLVKFMRVFDIILGLIMIPFGMVGFLSIAAFATVLWIPYFIWLIINKVFLPSIDDDFIEFIFICYGLAVTCLIAPFGIIESSIKTNN